MLAPAVIQLEPINIAGRRWGWDGDRLSALARSLARLGLQLIDPELDRVAYWTHQGLTAYDAAYVAVAEAAGLSLLTADESILTRAPTIARPLAQSRGSHPQRSVPAL